MDSKLITNTVAEGALLSNQPRNNTEVNTYCHDDLAQILGLDSEGKPLKGQPSIFKRPKEKGVTGSFASSNIYHNELYKGDHGIEEMEGYSPSVPELTPGSSKDGGSEPNSVISDGVNFDISIDLFDDKWMPFGPNYVAPWDLVDDVLDQAAFDKEAFAFDPSLYTMDANEGTVSHHTNQQMRGHPSFLPASRFNENEKSQTPLGEKDSHQNSKGKHQEYVEFESFEYKSQPGVLSSLEVPEDCQRQLSPLFQSTSREYVCLMAAENENEESSSSHSDCSTGFETDSTWSEDRSDCDQDFIDIHKIYEHLQLFGIDQSRNHAHKLGLLVQPLLTTTKRQMVDQIMREFWIIFNQEWTYNIQRHGTGSPESTSSSVSQRHNNGGNESKQRPEKRRREDEDDNDSKDNSERNRKRPRTDLTSLGGSDSKIKFACPYRKHNPRTYSHQSRRWRSCALSPLDTIARVKGHLYRYHRIFQCPRCKKLQKSPDELEEHTLAIKACELIHEPPAEGITDSIEKRLKSRKKSHQSQTQPERWQELYRILFPEEEVPSPYFEPIKDDIVHSPDSEELTSFEEFSRREVPRFFQSALEVAIAGEAHPIVERLKSQLVGMIQDCQDRAFAAYKTKRSEEAPTGLSQSPPIVEGDDKTSHDGGGTEIITRLYERVPPQTPISSQLETVFPNQNSTPLLENSSSDSGYVSEILAPNSDHSRDGHQGQRFSSTQQQITVDTEISSQLPFSMEEASIQQINKWEVQDMPVSDFTMDQFYLYEGDIDRFDVDNWLPLDDGLAYRGSTQ